MRHSISFLALMVFLCLPAASFAEMPAALAALGNVKILSEAEASAVRGGGAHLESGSTQSMSFTTGANAGNSTGSVTVFEGATATFKYSKVYRSFGPDGEVSDTLEVDGNLGGLTGAIGIDQNIDSLTFGRLNFLTGGKTLSETTSFSGDFKQDFFQRFGFSSPIQEMSIVRQ
jgi:hypothetical protein